MSEEVRVLRLMTRANLGGPARQMQALAGQWGKHGIRQLWCFGQPAVGETELPGLAQAMSPAAAEVKARRAEGPLRLPEFGRGMDPGGDLLTLRALTRLVRSFEPHLIHTHMAKAGVLGVALASRTRLPLVHSYHGHVLRDYYGPARSEGLRLAERALCKRRNAIHCVSRSCAEELIGLGLFARSDCTVIPSVLDPSTLEPIIGREPSRQILGIDPEEWALAWVGRLVPIKDPELLVATIRHLLTLHPERRPVVHVFGTGPLESRLRDASKGLPVRMHGSRPDLPRLLTAFDLMLSTSKREGYPVSILEALSQRLPVVGPRVPGILDLEGAGLTLTERRAEALAEACQEVQRLAWPVPASRAETLRATHAPESLAPRYAELYRDLLL